MSADLKLPAKGTRVPKKELKEEDFLNLLVTQLKNQDPLEPQSNEEFMTTMTQFNSLEALASIDRNIQYSQAISMIDRAVTVDAAEGEPVTGMVAGAGLKEGKVVVYVGGQEYDLPDVREILIRDTEPAAAGSGLIQAALLIGKEVLISTGSGEARGIVDRVGLSGGSVKVYVGGSPYDISGIDEIKEAAGEINNSPG